MKVTCWCCREDVEPLNPGEFSGDCPSCMTRISKEHGSIYDNQLPSSQSATLALARATDRNTAAIRDSIEVYRAMLREGMH